MATEWLLSGYCVAIERLLDGQGLSQGGREIKRLGLTQQPENRFHPCPQPIPLQCKLCALRRAIFGITAACFALASEAFCYAPSGRLHGAMKSLKSTNQIYRNVKKAITPNGGR